MLTQILHLIFDKSLVLPIYYIITNSWTIFQVDKILHLDPRPEFHRVVLEWSEGHDHPVACSTGSQMSSRLLSMNAANALLVLPSKSDDKSQIGTDELVDAMIIAKI